jgi:hypothetical protein
MPMSTQSSPRNSKSLSMTELKVVSFEQVTHLGGLEAVITGKKWSDVSIPFQFPASFTSKSFTLRKMYSKLLFNFEQVYLHRNTGPMSAPPGQYCFHSLSSFPHASALKIRTHIVNNDL